MVSRVLIDGVAYVPEHARSTIGVGVTTLDRQEALSDCLEALQEFSPPGTPIVVVDDGSKKPAKVPSGVSLVRHSTRQGIPAAKNRCLAELMERGVDHLFLLDDDTYPQRTDWWVPYVSSPEPHLQYTWTHFAKDNKAVEGMEVIYRDPTLWAFTSSMGCMLYVERRVVDAVGGMRWEFGAGYEEHHEWSERIHAAGFTSFVHQDVPGGGFYAADEHYAIARSFTADDRSILVDRNAALRAQLSGSTDYVEYRAQRDVVITSFFTGHPDPQRKNITPSIDASALMPLIDSVGKEDMVVLHNCFDDLPCENVRQECAVSPYVYRWLAQWRWLRDHPEVDACWLVDATDVRSLNDPFPHMRPGTLYCGWEPRVLDCDWTRQHCPPHLKDWVDEHGQEMLLNTGVVGGQRSTLMAVCRGMVDAWVASDRKDPLYEMALFNYVVRRVPGHLVTGPQVTTLFKANVQSDPHSWWSHK